MTPRQSLLAEVERRGRMSVVLDCARVLDGDLADGALLVGPAVHTVITGREGGLTGPWSRVWAARGLLQVFHSVATPALLGRASDPAWRVRETVAKVTAAHRVLEATAVMVAWTNDSTPRVRRAAERALARLADEA
jgi:hypothetical protein